jgi:hypothetical protein
MNAGVLLQVAGVLLKRECYFQVLKGEYFQVGIWLLVMLMMMI